MVFSTSFYFRLGVHSDKITNHSRAKREVARREVPRRLPESGWTANSEVHGTRKSRKWRARPNEQTGGQAATE